MVTADAEYIWEFILAPGRRLVAGYAGVMPSYRRLLGQDELSRSSAGYLAARAVCSPRTVEIQG